MIRLSLLAILLTFLCLYSWKNWFYGACWLVLLMGVKQHPDFPQQLLGLSGVNPWNLLFLNVVLSWLFQRRRQGLIWDMEGKKSFLLTLYVLVIAIGVGRLISDTSGLQALDSRFMASIPQGTVGLINEYFFNNLKMIVPGLIIYDGCRSREQFDIAATFIVFFYMLLALQIIKAMGLGSFLISGDELQSRSYKVLSKNVGLHRVNLSMLLAGAFWAIHSLKDAVTIRTFRYIIFPMCVTILVAQLLTAGRMGYVTWIILALIFSTLKWRRYLLAVPILVFAIPIFAPSIAERVLSGTTADTTADSVPRDEVDMETVTSGRVIAWPLVIEKIAERPLIGWGREAMRNSAGITSSMIEQYGLMGAFPHPHNAYLQWALDNGFVLFFFLVWFYYLVFKNSFSLFRDSSHSIYVMVGGICLAQVLSLLLAAFGSQSFYPREGSVALWASIGLMFRVYTDRSLNNQPSALTGAEGTKFAFKFF